MSGTDVELEGLAHRLNRPKGVQLIPILIPFPNFMGKRRKK